MECPDFVLFCGRYTIFIYITALKCRSKQCGVVRKDGSQPPREVKVGIKLSLQSKYKCEVFRHGEKELNTACVHRNGEARWSREPDSCKGKQLSF